jgi:hypothetical protein
VFIAAYLKDIKPEGTGVIRVEFLPDFLLVFIHIQVSLLLSNYERQFQRVDDAA